MLIQCNSTGTVGIWEKKREWEYNDVEIVKKSKRSTSRIAHSLGCFVLELWLSSDQQSRQSLD